MNTLGLKTPHFDLWGSFTPPLSKGGEIKKHLFFVKNIKEDPSTSQFL